MSSTTQQTSVSVGQKKSSIWSTGLAMFAMFFGAGNIVFPIALGQMTQDKNGFAVMGMVVTAVLMPLTGLLAMLLHEGDYNTFFRRIGKIPGFAVILMILGLIGPFAGIPRCITISYSTLSAFGLESLPFMNLSVFSLISCLIIFLFTIRPTNILSLMGYVLTPILLLSMGTIVFKGIFSMPEVLHSASTSGAAFSQGLVGGYNTMDLLAAFFFSSCVLLCLRKGQGQDTVPLEKNRSLIRVAVWGGVIAAALLAVVYVAFSFLAAGNSEMLNSIANHQMLGALAYKLLGPYGGLVAGVAVSLTVLTTEIALTMVFANFLQKTICKEKISYPVALGLTLFVTFWISILHFDGIATFLAPILQVCYPALIVLTLVNILHKLYDFKPVKLLFYGTFLVSLIAYFVK